jgi:hypothetical protein
MPLRVLATASGVEFKNLGMIRVSGNHRMSRSWFTE